MPENNIDRRKALQAALQAFTSTGVATAAVKLLGVLGYSSEKTADLGFNAEALLGNIEKFKPDLGTIDRAKVKAERWKSCAFLFQLTNDEIPSLAVARHRWAQIASWLVTRSSPSSRASFPGIAYGDRRNPCSRRTSNDPS